MKLKNDRLSKNEERFVWIFVLGIIICFACYGYYKFDVPIINSLTHGFAGLGMGTLFVKIFME